MNRAILEIENSFGLQGQNVSDVSYVQCFIR